MKSLRTISAGVVALILSVLIFATSRVCAQGASEGKADPAIAAAAEKAFKAIADDDVDALKPLLSKKYAKKLMKEELRPLQTGPKLAVSYDGNVRVMRANDKEAVVQATMFAPTSTDVPKGEASKLDLYLVKEKGEWLISAPNKSEAANDATIEGGWYHPGAFTLCPNTGIEYLGNHFSNKLNCQSTAVCR